MSVSFSLSGSVREEKDMAQALSQEKNSVLSD